jgi:hypothetical protein
LKEIRKRDVVASRIGQSEVRSELANLRRAVGRGKVFRQDENSEKKKPNNSDTDNSQDAAENFSAVGVGLAKGAEDTGGKQKKSSGDQEEIDPGKITGDGIASEKGGIADEGREAEDKSAPDTWIPASLHVMCDLGALIVSDQMRDAGSVTEICELLGVAVGDGDAEERLGFFGGIDFVSLRGFGRIIIAPEPDHLFGEFGGAVGGVVGAFAEAEMEVVVF